jgi:predicted acylesterase/phospholipase RssA
MNSTEGNSRIKVRLILPGGGVRAMFQAGFLKELQDSKMFEVEAVYGCSAGALLCPLIAVNRMDIMDELHKTITDIDDIFESWSFIPAIPGVSKNIFSGMYNGLQKILGPNSYLAKALSMVHLYFNLGMYKKVTLIDSIYNSLSKEERKEAEKKCNIVAWDIQESKLMWFKGRELYTAMSASAALYLVVPPVKYKKTYLADGGANDSYAISAIDYNYEGTYIMVDLSTRENKRYEKYPTNAISFIERLWSNIFTKFEEENLRETKAKLGERLLIVRPKRDIFDHNMDITNQKVTEAFSEGRMKYHEFLMENLKYLSKTKEKAKQNAKKEKSV